MAKRHRLPYHKKYNEYCGVSFAQKIWLGIVASFFPFCACVFWFWYQKLLSNPLVKEKTSIGIILILFIMTSYYFLGALLLVLGIVEYFRNNMVGFSAVFSQDKDGKLVLRPESRLSRTIVPEEQDFGVKIPFGGWGNRPKILGPHTSRLNLEVVGRGANDHDVNDDFGDLILNLKMDNDSVGQISIPMSLSALFKLGPVFFEGSSVAYTVRRLLDNEEKARIFGKQQVDDLKNIAFEVMVTEFNKTSRLKTQKEALNLRNSLLSRVLEYFSEDDPRKAEIREILNLPSKKELSTLGGSFEVGLS